VARFVARQRWQTSVLIDGRGRLRQVLPCPSVPYTYVLDGSGRIAVAQPGEVDWWAPATRAALRTLLGERDSIPDAAKAPEAAPKRPLQGA
jgi:hypothetical protein